MNFYKHYMGDYQSETGHLTLIEHGAYRQMLDTYYATVKPLPADMERLYRLLRANTRDEKAAVDEIVKQFWELKDGGYTNERASREIANAIAYADSQAMRSHKRWDNQADNQPHEQAQCPTDASHSHNQIPKPNTKTKAKKKDTAADAAMGLPDFILWTTESTQPHIKLLGEWADVVKPDCKTRGQWEVWIKRHVRAAMDTIKFDDAQIKHGFEKLRRAIKDGWLKQYTLETLIKFITGTEAVAA